MRRRVLGVGGLVAESAGAINAAEKDLQNVYHPACMEAVRVCRDSAHGVHADRASDGLRMMIAVGVGPRNVETHFLLESRVRQFGGDALDGFSVNAGDLGGIFGRVFGFEKSFCKKMEDGCCGLSAGKFNLAEQSRLDVRLIGGNRRICGFIVN